MVITEFDQVEVTFNERSGLWSLWLNGKIIKTAKNKSTLTKLMGV